MLLFIPVHSSKFKHYDIWTVTMETILSTNSLSCFTSLSICMTVTLHFALCSFWIMSTILYSKKEHNVLRTRSVATSSKEVEWHVLCCVWQRQLFSITGQPCQLTASIHVLKVLWSTQLSRCLPTLLTEGRNRPSSTNTVYFFFSMTQCTRFNKCVVPNNASCLTHITSPTPWEEHHRWRVVKWEICTHSTVSKRKHAWQLNVTSLNSSVISYETIPYTYLTENLSDNRYQQFINQCHKSELSEIQHAKTCDWCCIVVIPYFHQMELNDEVSYICYKSLMTIHFSVFWKPAPLFSQHDDYEYN